MSLKIIGNLAKV